MTFEQSSFSINAAIQGGGGHGMPQQTWGDVFTVPTRKTEEQSKLVNKYVVRLPSNTSMLEQQSMDIPIVDIPTALFQHSFVRTEEDDLMKSISCVVDKLMRENEDFTIISKPNLLDEITSIVRAFTPLQMRALIHEPDELRKRVQKNHGFRSHVSENC